MHSILQRQLNKLGLSEESVPTSTEQWASLLATIDRTFAQFESDRQFQERSMAMASEEMAALHQSLAAQNDTLEGLVKERTAQLNEALQAAHAINRDLDAARIGAEAANRAKSEFLAAMSHEIRTPLNGVIGTLDLLQGSTLTDHQRRYIRMGRTSALSLTSVINDILDFSKIEAGKLELSPLDFGLRGVVEDVIEMLAFRGVQKKIEVICTVAPNLLDTVHGDPDRLRQIIINLVNNAIKFTEQGSVTLLVTQGARPDQVRFSVTDTGIGIPPERMDRLFKAFSQADASTTRKYGGTGLGLAISKQLSELMGGAIGVESQAGRGSTFWFEVQLPACPDAIAPAVIARRYGPATDASAEIPALGRPAQRSKRLRVLLAEDNEINQLIAQEMLARLGLDCTIAPNGAAAVAAIRGESFDLVLMDCQMPEMDGFDATREIRRLERTGALAGRPGTLPIIALTANALQGDRERCLEAGMDAYTSKPIDMKHLMSTIDALLLSHAHQCEAA